MEYTLIILLLPLLAFLILGFGGKRIGDRAAGIAGVSATAASTLLSYLTVFRYFFVDGAVDGVYCALKPLAVDWLRFTDRLQVEIGILLDPISVMMLAVITTVSLMVHIYSLAYMRGEKGFVRYYAFLSLFGFSMLGLVVATNIFQMYIFWELVGVSSYLLIGFYYAKPSAVAASKKAFILTRFADLGFLVGILILSWMSGTFDFGALTADNAALAINSGAGLSFMGLSALTWAMALIFIGGAGKSAMFPLHIWLPDAMEGPTPVSALIHAATMVVAGVYLLARLFPVYAFAAPDVLRMISYIGAFTALFAAIIATVQTDVKRVLAFSTISQIAYMMVALGLSGFGGRLGLGYMASIFHLFTRLLQSPAVFGRRIGDPRRTQQRNERNGRSAKNHADHTPYFFDRLPCHCRNPPAVGLLQQRRDPGDSLPQRQTHLRRPLDHRRTHRLLHVPALLQNILGKRTPCRRPRSRRARIAARHDPSPHLPRPANLRHRLHSLCPFRQQRQRPF